MLTQMEVTPIEEPVVTVYVSNRGEGTPFPPVVLSAFHRPAADEQTPLTAYADAAPYILRQPAESQLGLALPADGDSEPALSPEQLSCRESRISLLVRKFEGDDSVEDDARFAILTARMRKLERSAQESTLFELSNVVSQIEQSTDEIEAVKIKYGLK